MGALDGKRIAFLTAPVGVEKAELEQPWADVTDAGATAVHVAPEPGDVQSMVGDVDKDKVFTATAAIDDVDAAEFDALVLPGGTVNADKVRADDAAVRLVKAFIDAGKPVAAICHGPWALVESGALPGKTLTSFPRSRPTSATPAARGSTRRSSTARPRAGTSSPRATPTTSTPSARRSSTSSEPASSSPAPTSDPTDAGFHIGGAGVRVSRRTGARSTDGRPGPRSLLPCGHDHVRRVEHRRPAPARRQRARRAGGARRPRCRGSAAGRGRHRRKDRGRRHHGIVRGPG